MNLTPITPYQVQKNLEELQKQYEDLKKKTDMLVELLKLLEKRTEEVMNNVDNLE